ncbi:MAG: hypothetical protein KF850_17145 [Labilithrix sp.]|nr:hypothetical protein [Labilithrix sp.]
MVARRGAGLLGALVATLLVSACASLVGIEEVVIVDDAKEDDDRDGGASGKIPASDDGGACLEPLSIAKCAAGSSSAFPAGAQCFDSCQCQLGMFCIKVPGKATGTCGAAQPCGSTCKVDWDCLSLVCEVHACQ